MGRIRNMFHRKEGDGIYSKSHPPLHQLALEGKKAILKRVPN
jgi:hypothetical protein